MDGERALTSGHLKIRVTSIMDMSASAALLSVSFFIIRLPVSR
jgi:hypothetical protein